MKGSSDLKDTYNARYIRALITLLVALWERINPGGAEQERVADDIGGNQNAETGEQGIGKVSVTGTGSGSARIGHNTNGANGKQTIGEVKIRREASPFVSLSQFIIILLLAIFLYFMIVSTNNR